MEEKKKTSTNKPYLHAIDFPELKELMSEEERKAYKKTDKQSDEHANQQGETLLRGQEKNSLQRIALSVLAHAKGDHKSAQVTCPNCNSSRCFINRSLGLWHCWSCDQGGILEETRDPSQGENSHYPSQGENSHYPSLANGGKVNSAYYLNAREQHPKDHDYVPMIPSDYKPVSPEKLSWLYPIYPYDTDEEEAQFIQRFHSSEMLARHPKARPLLTPQQRQRLQTNARRYCEAMGFSKEAVRKCGVMCAILYMQSEDTLHPGKPTGGKEEVDCIAYCNYLFGKVVNVKFRSVALIPGTDEYRKDWMQESPTTPAAPYGIDSIDPDRKDDDKPIDSIFPTDEHVIDSIIFTEGEKDRLTLVSCGFPYVLSVANGAKTDIQKSHEAFEDWIDQAQRIVVCGDTDLPGRGLVRQLLDHYGAKALVAELPEGCKDISEVYAQLGAEAVRRCILSAKDLSAKEVYCVGDHQDEVLQVMLGNYDHGYDVGMGPLTDHIFHPTSEGGLIVVTGLPNSGKTDFLNCLTASLMFKRGKRVAYFSFELPNKAKHARTIAQIALATKRIEGMALGDDGKVSKERVDQFIKPALRYLDSHMVDFRTDNMQPTPRYIISHAERQLREGGLDYLVIDPYLFMSAEGGNAQKTETEQVKAMLTQIQGWSRKNGVWTIIVAHPRIQYKEATQKEFAPLNIYSISGSAQWGNLADFIFTVTRVNKPDEDKIYTIIDMQKVRDQELSHLGQVYYRRQPCGRYDERESQDDCIKEETKDKVIPIDTETWISEASSESSSESSSEINTNL